MADEANHRARLSALEQYILRVLVKFPELETVDEVYAHLIQMFPGMAQRNNNKKWQRYVMTVIGLELKAYKSCL